MVNVSWLAELVFFVSYFAAWATKEIPHVTWLNVSAIAAVVIAALLVLYNGYSYSQNHNIPRA